VYKKVTIEKIKELKGSNIPFATITAYDFPSAQLVDSLGIPIILVGDSVAMVVLGYESTIPVTVEEMLVFVGAVSRGAHSSLVVADMPFMSYQASVEEAVRSAGRFIKMGGANAVKIEGGASMTKQIEQIVCAGIPVMGHVGLTPQSINQMSGYKIQGKTREAAVSILNDAKAVEQAGAFSIVLEGVPAEIGKLITEQLTIPTIGIGAGPHCDGQIQVYHDVIGLFSGFVPSHAHQYENCKEKISQAIKTYVAEVKNKSFPKSQHYKTLSPDTLKSLRDLLK